MASHKMWQRDKSQEFKNGELLRDKEGRAVEDIGDRESRKGGKDKQA